MQPIETPVINVKDKKKTLSFKPQKKAKVLRHVYSAPCERYWPLLDASKEADLTALLERTLVAAKLPGTNNKIPWKKLSKEQHKEMRKTVEYDEATISAKAARSSLILGLNAVSRALEKGKTSVVLLAQDIDPPMLGHHVSDLCLVKRVPLIVMKSLKQTTKNILGFSCMTLGIKPGQTHFTELEEHIIELSNMFPIPDGPMFKKVDGNNAGNSDDSDSDDSNMDDSNSDDCFFEDESSKLVQEKWDPSRLKDIYLLRTSRKERVFIPEISASGSLPAKEIPPKIDQQHFIPLKTFKKIVPSMADAHSETEHYRFNTPLGMDETTDDMEITSLPKKRKLSSYMPLVVKVVQSNPNKKKKNKKSKVKVN